MFESEQGQTRSLTFGQLYSQTNHFAGCLKSLGVKKGDRVAVYMPNIPETAVVMLASAKIGAIHSVVYAGFSHMALRDRIQACGAKILVVADGGRRRGKIIPLKATADRALKKGCASVKKVIVVRYQRNKVWMKKGRDLWFHDLQKQEVRIPATARAAASDPLFILYTSGTTAKPKGVTHVHGGYMVGVHRTLRWVFDLKDHDIYWCTADPGWITGHSYIIYGPLMAGLTSVMYDGAPDWPAADRLWKLVRKYRVSIFYTAPTLIRLLMKYGNRRVDRQRMSSLRLLGSVGEPINPEAWKWYYNHVGRRRCPIMDTWWQTETGMFMITPLPAMPLKAGSAGQPFPGVVVDIVDKDGRTVPAGKGGYLVVKKPWPAMLLNLYQNPRRYLKTYWKKIKGVYFSGDVATRDKDGYIWIQGRSDDVLKISGHRIGNAEIESALVTHPKVVEAAVIGIPDELRGEVAKAFVIMSAKSKLTEKTVENLQYRVRHQLGRLAVVKEIVAVNSLPKTRSGKIMRRVLKAKELGEPVGDTSTLVD